MVKEAVRTARAAGATGTILVRGDSAYGTSAVVGACLREKVQFSVVLAKNAAVSRAIEAIAEDSFTPVHYPGAVTARLVVRRVRGRAKLEELFPVWRYHPFFTNSQQPVTEADITHRRPAIVETVFADLIDGPLAPMPSSRFAANHAWAICAAMTHNLLRAAATFGEGKLAVARGATLRRRIIDVPARIARPQRRRVLHLPEHWPWARDWLRLWRGVFGDGTGSPVTV